MDKQQFLKRYDIDFKWRDAWGRLSNNIELRRKKYPLEIQLEYIEHRAALANERIRKLINNYNISR